MNVPGAAEVGAPKLSPADRYAAGALGHDRPTELHRLRLRERLIDPDTQAVLAGRGIQPWWRCLELGAGTGSIALWLADRCSNGQVVATDVDTRHLVGIGRPNLRVHRHDVVGDGFPAGSFDLIHARSLLANLPERDRVLSTMAGWLAPGGWLVVEDPCAFPLDSSPYLVHQRMMNAFERYLALSHGADLRWSRRLPARLAEVGLVDVGMRVFPQYVGDGGAGDALWRVALAQARPGILQSGLLTEAEFTAGLALFDAPDFVDLSVAMVSVWARRPQVG